MGLQDPQLQGLDLLSQRLIVSLEVFNDREVFILRSLKLFDDRVLVSHDPLVRHQVTLHLDLALLRLRLLG